MTTRLLKKLIGSIFFSAGLIDFTVLLKDRDMHSYPTTVAFSVAVHLKNTFLTWHGNVIAPCLHSY